MATLNMQESNLDKPQKRIRCNQACDQCRRRKAKCDGSVECSACRGLGLSCSYGLRIKQSKGSAYIVYLENKVNELEDVLQNLRQNKGNVENVSAPNQPNHLAGQEWDGNLSLEQITPDSMRLEETVDNYVSMPSLGNACEERSDSLTDVHLQNAYNAQFFNIPSATAAAHPECLQDWEFDAGRSDCSIEIDNPLSPDEIIQISDETMPIPDERMLMSNETMQISDETMQMLDYPSSPARLQTPTPKSEDLDDSSQELTQDQFAQQGLSKKSITQLRERNRVAAAKCRVKKKRGFEYLKAKHTEEQTRNDFLKSEVMALRNQLVDLRTMMLGHNMGVGDCGCAKLHKYNHQMAMKQDFNALGSKLSTDLYLFDPQTVD